MRPGEPRGAGRFHIENAENSRNSVPSARAARRTVPYDALELCYNESEIA